jgi:tyrosyl-tRNA synthetase
MLAREYCDASKRKFKPIVLSHHMLMGLGEGQAKMSKSDPASAIFVEDTEADVNVKIKKAYCPPGVIENNPILDYLKHIIFAAEVPCFKISRSAQNGGDLEYTDYEALEADYQSEAIHPGDLKPAVAKAINYLISPIRDHFLSNPEAKKLLEQVKNYRTTR